MILPWQYPMAWREARDKSFAWKVRWRMKHDRNPLLIVVQDKYRVKEYARERGVDSATVLHVTDRPESIPFDTLPENHFIKANHGCSWNIVCIDGALYRYMHGNRFIKPDGAPEEKAVLEKFRLSREETLALCKKWLGREYRRTEWAYRHIKPRIVVEEVLRQRGGGPFIDYRIYTMAGTVKMISVSGPLFFGTNRERLYFNAHWEPFELTKRAGGNKGLGVKPDTLDEMVQAAERLGKGLDFVRVDMYDTTQGVLLGEMTVYPDAGTPGRPSSSSEFNKWLGDQWVLPR